MSVQAIVNYHVHSESEQAYHIDACGEAGKLLSPKLDPIEVVVDDIRWHRDKPNFQRDSVQFLKHGTSIENFTRNDDWRAIYDKELRIMLTDQIDAKEVIVFDHTVRIDNPDSTRRPARNVHSDYSQQGAHNRLRDLIGDETARDWEAGHFAFINVWRPVEQAITSAPLGFIRPETVMARDWIELKLVYPDRVGSIMGVAANADHEWIFCSNMHPDEIVFFNIYDNQNLPSIAHSALDVRSAAAAPSVRKSIESRTLVRYR